MSWGSKDKNRICRRVRQVRVEKFGEGRGAQKTLAKVLGIPYTTYRGYEMNRINLDFLHLFSRKFRVPLLWLLCAEDENLQESNPSPVKQIGEEEPFIIERKPHRIIPMLDESMEPAIKKGALVVLSPIKDMDEIEHKLIAVQYSSGEILIRRAMKRGQKLLGFSENPIMKQPIVIDPGQILGAVTFQFSIPS